VERVENRQAERLWRQDPRDMDLFLDANVYLSFYRLSWLDLSVQVLHERLGVVCGKEQDGTGRPRTVSSVTQSVTCRAPPGASPRRGSPPPDDPVEVEEYGALLQRKGTRPWADVDREG